METQTFIIGNREFTCLRMNAFEANKLLLRIQKIAIPLLGTLTGSGKSLGDIDVKEAAQVVASSIDESIIDNIVLPMFAGARIFCVEKKQFIKSGIDIDKCFTAENLFDLYELIFEVARYQFGPCFEAAIARFGVLTDAAKPQESQAS